MTPEVSLDRLLAGRPTVWSEGRVQEVCARCEEAYVGEHGLLVSVVAPDGRVLDDAPLIPDFGDVLPYLAVFDHAEFALQQVERARPHLWRGLYAPRGVVHAFLNHDYLLGLTELFRITGDERCLEAAREAAGTLIGWLRREGRTLRKRRVPAPRSWLDERRTSPFCGGYIELLLEIGHLTGREEYLGYALEEGRQWLSTRHFRETGLFQQVEIVGAPRLSGWLARASRGPRVRLFKDNTNLVHALVALFRDTGEPWIAEGVRRWVDGFHATLFNGGDVLLERGGRAGGDGDVRLRAAFAAIDVLCEVHESVVRDAWPLELASGIAERWLLRQWSNRLLPERPGEDADHLDCNTDFAIALLRLGELRQEARYVEAALDMLEANPTLHRKGVGYVLSVDRAGAPVDERIITKYQALLLKAALVEREGSVARARPSIRSLLRDR